MTGSGARQERGHKRKIFKDTVQKNPQGKYQTEEQ